MRTAEPPHEAGEGRPRPGPPAWALAGVVALVAAVAVIMVIVLGDDAADPERGACADFAAGMTGAGPATAPERTALAGAVNEAASRSASAPFREAAAGLLDATAAEDGAWERAALDFADICRNADAPR
ncbi:hypothetical protein [Streptomyces sp. MP131-18]|uniref:hypothetical protein n=1 Tax=Streptomyces sp. MP131-18 TaxID=1857892 RepID=UPI00097C1602|nr:hypothetical protein [Streptomyces sp. MP131-18]ONK11475.1 hypothetical protein STBA_22080 [Streptomyces sp. MP131-18]